MPSAFAPLTHEESVVVLEDAIQWLVDETRATLALPDGPFKSRRLIELRGRDRSLVRDFGRLVREQEG